MNFEKNCQFPIAVVYDDGDLSVTETIDGLTVCRSIDIKAGQRGRFANARITDSNGVSWRMVGAEKAHGIGAFWGFNLLLSQTIRARILFAGEPKTEELSSFKDEVIKRLKKRDALTLVLKIGTATIDQKAAEKLVPAIENATAISQVIFILMKADFPERQRWEQSTL